MRTSEVDDDVLLPSPGNNIFRKLWNWCLQITKKTDGISQGSYSNVGSELLWTDIEGVAGEVKWKSTLNSTSLKSDKQVNSNVPGKYCQNKEAAGAVFECQTVGCGFNIGDQWHHHPRCRMNKSKDRFLEVSLMGCSFLLSFANAGAFYFTQALAIVGSHDDPVLKHSLATLNRVFAASFFSNFLGMFVLVVLQSRSECHRYKKFSLIISNAASFLFMVLGYGFLIAFNIQRLSIKY